MASQHQALKGNTMSCPVTRPELKIKTCPKTGKFDLQSLHEAMEAVYSHLKQLREFKNDLDEQVDRWLSSDGGESESMKRLNYQLRYHSAFGLPEFAERGIGTRKFDGTEGVIKLAARADQVAQEIDHDIAVHSNLCAMYVISSTP